MDSFSGVASAELLATAGLATYMIAGFRRAFPQAASWVFWLAVALAGQAASFLTLLMQGDEPTTQHIAYHVVMGILAASGEPLVNRAHVGAEARKNNVATIPPVSRDVV